MDDDITLEEVAEDGHEPATKRDLAGLRGELHDLRGEVGDLRQQMATMKEEILDHFDVAVENIEESLKGANADEISLLQNQQDVQEGRITALEKRTGLR